MTESTKAPSALDALDSDEEDRLSQYSASAHTSGKRSKAKPQHKRNENAQAKNLRKAFVFQKLMTREEADAMTNQECFAFRELDRENKRAINIVRSKAGGHEGPREKHGGRDGEFHRVDRSGDGQ